MAVCVGTFTALIAGYVTHLALNRHKMHCSDILEEFGGFLFLSFILAFLSPVLQSLTVSYSNDTVSTLVVIFSLVHLWAYDFTTTRTLDANKRVVRSPTSLNAIFVAAIVLSSRLNRFVSVFLLLFQSLLLFGFGPYFRSEIWNYSRLSYELFTIFSTMLQFAIIFTLNNLMGAIYLLSAAVLAFGGPLLFIYAYRYKNDIRGPWDLPKVKQFEHLT